MPGWRASSPPPSSTRGWITGLLVADLVIAVALVALLAVRLTQLWLDRRRGAAGSRLHMRLVLVCSLFTITPTLIVTIILSLLVINLTDFVVKPAQASYEAARAIGEPVRRAREEEILRDIGGDLPSSLQAIGIDAVRDKEATTSLLERLIDGRPIIEAIVVDADKDELHVLERAVAPNAEGLKDPMPSAQALWRAVNQNGPVEIAGAQRRLLRHAALRRRAAVPGDRPLRRPAGRRLHQEHRVRRLLLLADRAGHAAQPAPDLRRSAAPSRS